VVDGQTWEVRLADMFGGGRGKGSGNIELKWHNCRVITLRSIIRQGPDVFVADAR
jgi:hypothetical protein